MSSAKGATALPGLETPQLIETVVSPFHCFYQDALHFHTQSHLVLSRSQSESSRLARSALLFYVSGFEAMIHQAATELGRPDLSRLVDSAERPLPLADAVRLLPSIVVGTSSGSPQEFEKPPWPQLFELIELRDSLLYPGPAAVRKAFYCSNGSGFDPLEPHQIPEGLALSSDNLLFPRTGLPRDPYALRPRHLDTVRGIIDACISSLDRRLDGALVRENRHRRETTRFITIARTHVSETNGLA